ncbi:hypothetical protein JD844_006554 [Phrynosoma platyrhinos]|uniref:G-protein coupled receptors family 1 profile domain-containing protein n=1 Tax=Phrynosoma platyrhinos TaxID=52577 RepID=A0ABQ7T289_PHRPL|nr:hypothetical protein JD844_006554 [Phrynosoma platyrhinos]
MPSGVANGTHLFPFFSDFKGSNRVLLSSLETAVLASVFLLALAANLSGMRRLLAKKRKGGGPRRLRGASGCLVFNLFCADLIFILAIPLILVVRWTESWHLGEPACHLLFYLISLGGSVAILSLAALSLERLVSIVRLRPSATAPAPPDISDQEYSV